MERAKAAIQLPEFAEASIQPQCWSGLTTTPVLLVLPPI